MTAVQTDLSPRALTQPSVLQICGRVTTLGPAPALLVEAYDEQGAVLAQAMVAANGHYQLELAAPRSGLLVLRTLCRYQPVQAKRTLRLNPADDELRAVLALDQRKLIQADIHPLTELLVRYLGLPAGAVGCRYLAARLPAARLRLLTRRVARAFGLGDLQVATASEREQTLATVLVALQALADVQQQTLSQILNQLANALDRRARLNCDAKIALLLAVAETGRVPTCALASLLGVVEAAQLFQSDSSHAPAPHRAPTLEQLQQLGSPKAVAARDTGYLTPA